MPKPHDNRKPLNLEPHQGQKAVSHWTPEQIRLGGSWAANELAAQRDPTGLHAAYPWRPGWTTLSASVIFAQVNLHHATRRQKANHN